MGRRCRQLSLVLGFALAVGLAGCSGDTGAPVNPSLPPAAPPVLVPITPFLSVTDPITGFSTTDLYDSDDRIVRVTRDNELILSSHRLPGFSLEYVESDPRGYIIAGNACPETRLPGLRTGCSLAVVFGTQAGQRRAYLTIDYGDDYNPGTLVGLFVADGALHAFATSQYPPGTATLSGVVTAMTESGAIPVEGADVRRRVAGGWRQAMTDEGGFYRMPGLMNNTTDVSVSVSGWSGCQTQTRQVAIHGDTGLDVQLVCD